MKPSSSTTGFFQIPPTIPPQFSVSPSSNNKNKNNNDDNNSDDPTLTRILSLYLPTPLPRTVTHDLTTFAALVLTPQLLQLTVDAETTPPSLSPLTTFGAPNTHNPLRTSEGWRRLQETGIAQGIVALGFEEQQCWRSSNEEEEEEQRWSRRMHQFAKLLLWQGSAAMVTCPSAMTDGAAVLLGRHVREEAGVGPEPEEEEEEVVVKRRVFGEVRRRLVSRVVGEAWTSGQWMTERAGGSDVSGTETVATQIEGERRGEDAVGMPLGNWRVDGFKWFSSATDSDAAVLLAKTREGLGVSLFYAPMRRRTTKGDGVELNGVRISRLKNKMGTKPVPTAELELNGMRAWMVGEEGNGIREISAILNITRLHTGIANVGYWSRALAVTRAFSRVRKIRGGQLLAENAQHAKWMADETVKYAAATHLVMFGAALLGASEQGPSAIEGTFAAAAGLIPTSPADIELLLRIMTPLLKGQTTLASTAGLRTCMESLGGVGYLENNENPELNIARLFRDSVVSSIWEGTTSVMAEDAMRVLKGRNGTQVMDLLERWVTAVWKSCRRLFEDQWNGLIVSWRYFKDMIREKEAEELLIRGREVLHKLESIVCAYLLMADAVRDGDEIAAEIARRWLCSRLEPGDSHEDPKDWRSQAQMDKRIFLGVGVAKRPSKM